MWVGDVDIPQDLVSAHRRGELVLFVGAGASISPPSGLPSFQQLARDIAAESYVELTDHDSVNLDAFLGRLQESDSIDVHSRVKAHIDLPDSRPNAVHESIAGLAIAGPPVRIVTTNYDPHLTSALAAAGAVVPEALAPALPMGDDFEGLIYLHGRTQQEARRLVVTDRDFGQAYLTDAWAARFLERMFSRFTVMFVGYSHDDIVMSYLARGLRHSARHRYALTPDPHDDKWRRLAIRPIGYAVADGSHDVLNETLQAWTARARMGLLDHRQRITELVQAPPSQVPEEQSYLEDLLTDPVTTRLFTEHARDPEWLQWVATRPEFAALVDNSVEPTETTRTLAYWVAERFITSEQHTELALEVLRDAGGRISGSLWHAIGHWLHITGQPRPDWLNPWVAILIENAPRDEHQWLAYALSASKWTSQRETMLLLFDHLTEPQGVFVRSYGLRGRPRLEVRLRDDADEVRQGWQSALLPHLEEVAYQVLAIAQRHLYRARALLVSSGSASADWDPVSFTRSAIQPHPQDGHAEPIDVIVDAARDALDALLRQDPTAAASIVSVWARSTVPLLQRLAVHAWAEREDVGPDQKLDWLLEQGRLYETHTHQEVFHLLSRAFPHSSQDRAEALVQAAMAGPDHFSDEVSRAYAIYNLLGWLVRHAPDRDIARRALEDVQHAHPEFQERPHPEVTSWMESGFVRPQPPMATAELLELLRQDPDSAIAELRRYERVDTPWDGPTWSDALSVLTEAVTEQPEAGFAALDASGQSNDITGAVIRGWGGVSLDAAAAVAIAERLASLITPELTMDLSRLLSQGGQSTATPTEWHRLPEGRRLARGVWNELLEDTRSGIDGPASLTTAINHPAGHLAQFWLRALSADWRAAGDTWSGITAELREPLEELLGGHGTRSGMAEIVVASQVLLCFGADRPWCESNVLPLLSWDDAERARRTWDGYLAWGRANDQLLQAGLFEQYLITAQHVAEFPEDRQRQLAGHLTGIALFTSVDSTIWTRRLTATAPLLLRVQWLTHVADALLDLSAQVVETQWLRWLHQYWSDRVAGKPKPLAPAEANAIAAWAIPLQQSVPQAVDLVTAVPGSLERHSDLLRHLTPDRLNQWPESWRDLVAHLLRGTDPPFYDCHQLRDLVAALRKRDARLDLYPLLEHAIRLGCQGAADW